MEPLTLATVSANGDPIDTAVCTYFPDALFLWHSRHIRGINVGREKDRVLVNVGTRRISGKQHDECNHEREETNEAVAQGKERGTDLPRAKILYANP